MFISYQRFEVFVRYIICLTLCVYCNSELTEGEQCITSDGLVMSKCIPLLNCEYALDLIDNRIFPTFCNNGFEGKFNDLVCCNMDQIRITDHRQRISAKMCRKYHHLLYKSILPVRFLMHGGEESVAKEFPHMALIGTGPKNNIQWICGGSLISEKFVLTAAHCIYNDIGPVQWVRLGELDISDTTDDADPQDFRVVREVPYPSYRMSSYYHDIGLLELDSQVAFTDYIKPICLPQSNDMSSIEFGVGTGFGRTAFRGKLSSHLMKAVLEIVNNTSCNKTYSDYHKQELPYGIVENIHICAGGNEGKGHCERDSGGPLHILREDIEDLLHQYYIVGITSFGLPCDLFGSPGVFTRIFYYLDWIEKIVWPL